MKDFVLGVLAVAKTTVGGLDCSELVFSDLIFRNLTSMCLVVNDPVFRALVFSKFMATLPSVIGTEPRRIPER
jgi:hypothetical protein